MSYELLGLISFLTFIEDEVRAWTVRRGTTAHKAAGKVHSDIERGFIRAEVLHYEEFERLGSIAAAREKGLLKLEGKNYGVKDGDIITRRGAVAGQRRAHTLGQSGAACGHGPPRSED